MEFRNAYEDDCRAAAYDQLELGGTYHLAFRDLPELLGEHARGRRALDFGCGTGRSTRWLQDLGFETIGVDIAREMVSIARARDGGGDYRLIVDGDFEGLPKESFDLVLSAFTFDNIPTLTRRVRLFRGLRDLLAPQGRLVNLVSTPEIYWNEWVSFTTKDFPQNRLARSGDVVRIITIDHPDHRPVEDILWCEEDYREVYRQADLEPIVVHRPLARGDEPIPWVSEITIAPWAIYALRRREK